MTALSPLPHRNSPDFRQTAESNMHAFGDAPQELGRLIQDAVVDFESRAMAYDIHPATVNTGAHVVAFGVNEGGEHDREGSTHIMTVPYNHTSPNDPYWSGAALDLAISHNQYTKRMDVLQRSHGVKGLIQLAAGDPETGVIITERAPGRHLSKIAREEGRVPELSREHERRLRRTARRMFVRGVSWRDVHDDNFTYDSNHGVTLLDTTKGRQRPKKVVDSVKREFAKQKRHQERRSSGADLEI